MSKTAEKIVSPAWNRWSKARQKIKTVLHGIEINPSPHGAKWKRKMIYHWGKQLEEFDLQEPDKYE